MAGFNGFSYCAERQYFYLYQSLVLQLHLIYTLSRKNVLSLFINSTDKITVFFSNICYILLVKFNLEFAYKIF